MDIDQSVGFKLLNETVGLKIRIETDEYQETPGYGDEVLSRHRVVFQAQEEEPDLWAFGILFLFACVSFLNAKPRGMSAADYDSAQDWKLGHFVQGLSFESGVLRFSGDYIDGRCVKTDVTYEPGGRVTLETRNRARSADRWLLQLQGKRHLTLVESGQGG